VRYLQGTAQLERPPSWITASALGLLHLAQQLAGAPDGPRLDPHLAVHQRAIVSLPTCPRFCPNLPQFPNGGAPIILAPGPLPGRFPRTRVLRLFTGTEFAPRHLCEKAPAIALAARLDPDLGRDHRHHADDLRLRCKPVRIEAIGRPRKVVVHAVEAKTKEMLSLLGGAPPVPAAWLVGAGDGG
jgi:hypothetical protein